MQATITVALNRFPQLAARMPEAVNDALNRAALDTAEHADTHVPVDEGNLRANKTLHFASGGNHESGVDWNEEHGPYIEYGRGPIQAKPGRYLVFEIDSVTIFARSVGPAAPQPFAVPAHDYAAGRLKQRLSNLESELG